MSGYNDGYGHLMRPGDGDWNGFRRGQEAARHDQVMADMARSNHESAMNFISSQSRSNSASAGAGAGGYFGGSATSPGAVIGSVKWLLGIIGALVVATLLYNGAWKASQAIKAQQKAARDDKIEAQVAAAEPILRKQLLAVGDQDVPALVDRYIDQSACHRIQAAMRFRGETSVIGCYGAGAVQGHMDWSYFIAQDDLPSSNAGTLRIEARVFPLAGPNLFVGSGGPTSMQNSDKEAFLSGLAVARKAGLLKRPGCAVVSTELWLSKEVGEVNSGLKANAYEKLVPRIGCLTAKGFRFVV